MVLGWSFWRNGHCQVFVESVFIWINTAHVFCITEKHALIGCWFLCTVEVALYSMMFHKSLHPCLFAFLRIFVITSYGAATITHVIRWLGNGGCEGIRVSQTVQFRQQWEELHPTEIAKTLYQQISMYSLVCFNSVYNLHNMHKHAIIQATHLTFLPWQSVLLFPSHCLSLVSATPSPQSAVWKEECHTTLWK